MSATKQARAVALYRELSALTLGEQAKVALEWAESPRASIAPESSEITALLVALGYSARSARSLVHDHEGPVALASLCLRIASVRVSAAKEAA